MLDDLFARLRATRSAAIGSTAAGRGGEREETTKPYEFGDPFHLDLRGTLDERAPRDRRTRPASGWRAASRGVRLSPADFEVFRTEQLTRTSTVLLVDMSRSMLLRGCFVAAKKVAVALDTLIRTQFPRDHLTVIGFAYYAREIRPEALAELSWHGYEYGTNLQHGLMLARRILARQHGGERADRRHHRRRADRPLRGRPGRVQLPADAAHDPARRCARSCAARATGITINTFMLERSRALAEFVALVTRLNRGRAFYADAGAPRRVRPRRLRRSSHEARCRRRLRAHPRAILRPSGERCRRGLE